MEYTVNIGWLYPALMSTYGDRGNILVLQKRCLWRDIQVSVIPINQESSLSDLKKVDFIFGGGSQDREQEIVMRDLKGEKQEVMKELIENNIPALFVCGSPQLMGKYYEPAVGQRIEGLGIFDMVSQHPGPDKPRLIGNTVAEVIWENLIHSHPGEATTSIGSHKQPFGDSIVGLHPLQNDKLIVGFENHGGRTYLGKNAKPFAKVIKGFGNNGEDGHEGVVYKNAIGCYFHGPLLPKNPTIADFLIKRSLEVKYNQAVDLKPLDDKAEIQAHDTIVKRLGVAV
jgi:CobQ-like glutamine amidotransferase family enzyme